MASPWQKIVENLWESLENLLRISGGIWDVATEWPWVKRPFRKNPKKCLENLKESPKIAKHPKHLRFCYRMTFSDIPTPQESQRIIRKPQKNLKEAQRIFRNPKESWRISKNLWVSSGILKNPCELQRIFRNLEESQRILKNLWESESILQESLKNYWMTFSHVSIPRESHSIPKHPKASTSDRCCLSISPILRGFYPFSFW